MSNIERKYVELVESLIAQLGGTPVELNSTTNYDQRFTQLVAQAIPLLVQVAAGGAGAVLPGDIVTLPDVQTPLINLITGLGGTPSDPNDLELLFSEWAIATLGYVQDRGGTLANGAVLTSLNGLIDDLGGTPAATTGDGTDDAIVAIAALRPLIAGLQDTGAVTVESTTPPPPPSVGENILWRHLPSNVLFYYDFDFGGDEYWVSTEVFPVAGQAVLNPADFPSDDTNIIVPLMSLSYLQSQFRIGIDGYSLMGILPFDADLGQPLQFRAGWDVTPCIYSQSGGSSDTNKDDWDQLKLFSLAKFEHQRVQESWEVRRGTTRYPVITANATDDRQVIAAVDVRKDPLSGNDPKALRLSLTLNVRYIYKL